MSNALFPGVTVFAHRPVMLWDNVCTDCDELGTSGWHFPITQGLCVVLSVQREHTRCTRCCQPKWAKERAFVMFDDGQFGYISSESLLKCSKQL